MVNTQGRHGHRASSDQSRPSNLYLSLLLLLSSSQMPQRYPQYPDPPNFTDWESYDKFRETWTIPSIPTLLSTSTTRPDGTKASLVQQMLEQLRNGAPGFTEFATSGASNGERTVSVPLQKLDRCYVCAKTEGLRLCNSCASVSSFSFDFRSRYTK